MLNPHHHESLITSKRSNLRRRERFISQACSCFLASVLFISTAIPAARARGQACAHANPTVIIAPAVQSGFAGQQLTYGVTVVNNDSAGCGPSTFLVMATFPEAGFVHTPDCFRVTLSPGQSGSRNVVIKSPPNSCGGPKTFREVATNETVAGFSGSADAIFNVTSLGVNCGQGFCVPLAPESNPKQPLDVKLRRALGNNTIPSALATAFFQMARRFQLGLGPDNPIEQAAFAIFQQLSPAVREVLACSVRTFDSLTPDDRNRLFAPELTGLGDQPISQEALARAVANELLRRAGLQAYGDADCVFQERPGVARQLAAIDPGEINFRPRIFRVNGLRTDEFLPRLTLAEYTSDELQQQCQLDAGSQLNCRIQRPPCPGNSRDGVCLRVADVRAGDAVTLEGMNFLNVNATARLSGPVSREVEAHVCGDVRAETSDPRITDSRVRDKLSFKVPEGIPVGVYRIQLIVPNNTGKGGPSEFASGFQFINVLPSPADCFQIAAEELKADDQTNPELSDDEVGLRILTTPFGIDLTPGQIAESNFEFGGLEDGSTRPLNRVLFKQSGVGGVAMSVIGFEIDDRDAFKQQVREFSDAYALVVKGSWGMIADEIGVLAGSVAAALGLGVVWGKVIAEAVALAIKIGIALWAPADLIIEDFTGFTALDLAALVSPGFPIPSAVKYTTDGGIVVTVGPVRKDVEYLERRIYVSGDEGSTYSITLRYNQFLRCP
ncbi:MAG: hypothetical protein ACLGJB_23735 [Blastocatellia bacterium]